MKATSTLARAIVDAVLERVPGSAPGAIVLNVRNIPVAEVGETLADHGKVYLSIVGAPDEKQLVEWANHVNWGDDRIGFTPTHAVRARNMNVEDGIRLVLVWKDGSRLNSLIDRGYSLLGPRTIIGKVAELGANAASTAPQTALWKALGSDDLAPFLSLDAVLRFYGKLISDRESKNPAAARDYLPELGFLKDTKLLAPISSEEAIIKRLLANAAIVERFHAGDRDDLARARRRLEAAEASERVDLQRAFSTLLRAKRGAADALDELTLDEAHDLLRSRGKKLEKDPDGEDKPGEGGNGGASTQIPQYDGLSDATLHLIGEGESDALEKLVSAARKKLTADVIEGGTLTSELAQADFVPSLAAVSVARKICGPMVFGGRLRTEDNLDEVLDEPGKAIDTYEPFDEVWLAHLEDLLERSETVAQAKLGDASTAARLDLRSFVEARQALLPELDLLATEPLPLLTSSSEALAKARALIHAYTRFLGSLIEHLEAIRSQSPSGVNRIVQRVLGIDALYVASRNEEAALLTPLSPLSLWKYVEVADFLRERYANLAPEDRELIDEQVLELPEPLLVLAIPGSSDATFTRLAYSGRFASMPIYREMPSETIDVGRGTVEVAARKLAALYPMVKRELLLAAVNPQSTREISRAIQRLTDRGGFEKVRVGILRWGTDLGPLPRDNVTQQLHEAGIIEVSEHQFASQSDGLRYLSDHPVHLLLSATNRKKSIDFVARENARLHPLSLPQRIHADPVTGDLELRPRGTNEQSVEDAPFDLYGSLIPTASGFTDFGSPVSRTQKVQVDALGDLLAACHFLLVPGYPGIPDDLKSLQMSRGTGPSEDTVLSAYDRRVVSGIDAHLRRRNLIPAVEGIRRLVTGLQVLGGDTLFSLISDKDPSGFSESALTGQLALAVVLEWYRAARSGQHHAIVSLDSPLANRWLRVREDNHRTDLLSLRLDDAGRVFFDLIEVKGYRATSQDDIGDSRASQQLLAASRVLNSILSSHGDILSDRRRELLRLQIFREGLAGAPSLEPDWIDKINKALDCEIDSAVNLIVAEVLFDQNIQETEEHFDGKGDDGPAFTRLRLGESAIQEHLRPFVRKKAATVEKVGETRPKGSELQESETAQGTAKGAEPKTEKVGAQEPPSTEQMGETPAPSDSTVSDAARSSEQAAESPVLGFEPDQDELEAIESMAKRIYRVLQNMSVQLVDSVDPKLIEAGPSIIRYKVKLQSGEGLQKLRRRGVDLMRELRLHSEPFIDNVPGTDFVSLDLPRDERKLALLMPLLRQGSSPVDFGLDRHGLWIPVGVRSTGAIEWVDVSTLPHMLVAGSTGAGKTMFLYSIVMSLATLYSPGELEMVAIDPKQTDFVYFEGLPHLRGGKVIYDAEDAASTLQALITTEVEERTARLKQARKRDIRAFNTSENGERMRPLVVVIDEFADLSDVMSGSDKEEFEQALRRLTQRARNVGIHLVLATQRPTTDIVAGTIKANLPCRVSFRLASYTDSMTILDEPGAEKLLGAGDMLLWRGGTIDRLQAFFVSDSDLDGFVTRDE